ncbi:MAG TPA: TonB-dependent receptor, partial [Vicinamibacterales bacterium]|nr:TonB-dependent receptor [Vicinamibacterales bacterium]
MSRPVISAIIVVVASATPAFAQLARGPRQVTMQASAASGMVSGTVRDDQGQSVPGVAVTAIGTAQAQVRTDSTGAFNLALVPGEYVLRATRDGYVSPYKELVRVGASQRLQRNITITKQPDLPQRKVLLAGMTPSLTGERTAPASTSASSKSVQDWYLRHLPRTILRDESGKKDSSRADFKYLPSFLDWVVAESAQAAESFFSDTDFSGQINVLTTSAMSASQGWLPAQLPRGIAYLAVGAPVGVHGDWRLRGALSTGGLASWVALGEYEARPVKAHAFRVGMSYGMQRAADELGIALLKSSDRSRAVASIDGRDRWRVRPGLELDYGLRLDRYDYVAGQDFVSPRIGGRMGLVSRTFLTALVSSAVVAPGANEFLPPPTSGPWLPPERTFSALVPGAPFRPERIQRYEAGVEREFGMIGQSQTIGVRWFHETSRNQMATMFGLAAGGAVGHYYVATPGDVEVEGWAVRVSGQFTSRVKASMDYSMSRARWQFGNEAGAITRAMPSAVRPAQERLHDVTSTLEAAIPETETNVSVAYRLNSAFTRQGADGIAPIFAGRFDVQVRQALPYQPINGGRIDLLVSV